LVVGNGGFCIESGRLLKAKLELPFAIEPLPASDVFICKTHRAALEARGFRFATVEDAVQFSTEQTGWRWPSFGFHGRRDQPEKYARGWGLIEVSEALEQQ
jgi:hypothetical protein